MKLHYYPGCTLKEKTTNLDMSTREAMKRLDVELIEPEGWTCCGAEYPLTEEKIVGLAAPIRVLRQVRDEDADYLMTTCSFCYSVFKRANKAIQDDPIKHKRINTFLRDDIKIDPVTKEKSTDFEDYDGEIQVLHLLEYLRDMVGYAKIQERMKRDLSGLKIAPYYGCRLLRPQDEIGLDEPDDPHIFEEFLRGIGCSPVDYAFRQECCGSYLAVSLPDAATEASYRILRAALMEGAQAIAVTCPLCFYNMDRRQKDIKEKYLDFPGLPVLFFTQLLAWGLGVDKGVLGLDQHTSAVAPLFQEDPNAEVTL